MPGLWPRRFGDKLGAVESMAPAAAQRDEMWMREALALAHQAAARGDVPVGAVVVVDGRVVGVGRNRREADADPTGHAEIVALRDACRTLGRWRADAATLVVTLEPCPMCAGALVNARVGRLVYGAADPKAGAVESLYEICTDPRLNHRLEVRGGVLAAECGEILSTFFAAARQRTKQARGADPKRAAGQARPVGPAREDA